MNLILNLIGLIFLLATVGCIFPGDREDRGGRGHAEGREHTDHGAGHDGDREDHR